MLFKETLRALPLTCATGCVSDTDIGAHGVVTPLADQAAVVTRHTLVNVLTLAPDLLKARRTRIIFPKSMLKR